MFLLEESKNEEVVTTFAEFTSDLSALIKIPPFLNFFYPGLLNRILVSSGLYNPAIKHRNILIKYIKNQVCNRLQGKAKYGDSWKRPDDLLQDIIEQENIDFNNVNYPSLADKMLLFLFASIHTTSNGCANALMDLASRPQYMQELYEEQLEVHKEADENGVLPFEALDNMKKLDSFIRETLRLTGPNPKSFEPFRHIDKNAPASKISKNFVLFGAGKHACPGRYFAISEIKFFMHNIILKYNIRTESGKIEGRKLYGPTAYPSPSGIIIEKRKAK
ncbi:cytochrome P450 [Rhizophagus irregularis]|uniref:Cytochrome P450 n=1 Tax=Rhizophagus irregularis TaxID=588596 RepID=A0A2N1NA84_9GLOM|nr:cytochrome P450 [Rhizophagus irregularis]